MLGWAPPIASCCRADRRPGFGGIAGASAGIAQILFFVFIVLFAVAMIAWRCVVSLRSDCNAPQAP
jgi:uncharacterized membrane protein YtjA (UPF0391 family)